ncbi:MAG: hypothetical protein Kow0037_16300 [Calditrichia bacterium]
MRFKSVLLAVVFMGFLNINQAQYMAGPKMSGVGLPYFQTEVFKTFSPDGKKHLVRVYLQILNDDLTFIREARLYLAGIEFEILLQNKEGQTVFNQTFKKNIITESFEETNSRTIRNTFSVDIELEAGDYQAIVTVLDRNSSKQVNRRLEFTVDDLADGDFLMSDILYFTSYQQDSTGRIVNYDPSLTGNFTGGNKYIYFHFTTLVNEPDDSLNIQYRIKDAKKNVILFNQYSVINEGRYKEHFIRINRLQFTQNRYQIEIIGRYHGKAKQRQKLFTFYWTVTPESPHDLTTALEQMRYIMEADSVNWALKQPYDVQKAYFIRFWKRMDPNPQTAKNELMDEFYRRVNLANQMFSSIAMEGWRTDRGRIFIKFGQPDDIERHPFEIDTFPYEIWRYYNLRKTFLFIDRTGFGDYYLHPNYLEVEYN